MPNNSLIVECGEKSRYISYNNIYLTDVDYTTYSYVYSFDGEGTITSAIDYVISDELPKVYKLEGHGEAELPAEFQTQIEKENMEMESFSLLNMDEIPEDADALLIYAPESDISSEEATLLEDYLEAGGKLLVIAGPTESGTLTNLYSVLESYGVEAADGLVVEAVGTLCVPAAVYSAAGYSVGRYRCLLVGREPGPRDECALQPDWRARSGADSQQVSELQLSDDLRVGGVDAQDVDDRRDPRRIRGLRCVYGH